MAVKPILYISPLSPPHGGIATWTETLIRYGLPDGTPIHLVDTRIRGTRNIFSAVYLSWRECQRNVSIIAKLLYQCLYHRPQLVHISCSVSPTGLFRDLLCVLLVRLLLLPVVSHYHANLPDLARHRYGGLSGIALGCMLRWSHLNIVENQPSYGLAQQLLGSVSPNKLCLLPNFIADEIFNKSTKDAIDENRRYQAIFVGGITQAKGCAHLLQVARQRPDIDFHLYGVMHADMAVTYATAPANVFLHGAIAHEKLLDKMACCDFLLFPSYTEGFPLTLLEAMSLGLPVIATRVGAIPEMIDEGLGGYLVDPGDEAALIIAVNRLTAESSLLTTMGLYNRDKSERCYRYSVVINQMMALYATLLGGISCVV